MSSDHVHGGTCWRVPPDLCPTDEGEPSFLIARWAGNNFGNAAACRGVVTDCGNGPTVGWHVIRAASRSIWLRTQESRRSPGWYRVSCQLYPLPPCGLFKVYLPVCPLSIAGPSRHRTHRIGDAESRNVDTRAPRARYEYLAFIFCPTANHVSRSYGWKVASAAGVAWPGINSGTRAQAAPLIRVGTPKVSFLFVVVDLLCRLLSQAGNVSLNIRKVTWARFPTSMLPIVVQRWKSSRAGQLRERYEQHESLPYSNSSPDFSLILVLPVSDCNAASGRMRRWWRGKR